MGTGPFAKSEGDHGRCILRRGRASSGVQVRHALTDALPNRPRPVCACRHFDLMNEFLHKVLHRLAVPGFAQALAQLIGRYRSTADQRDLQQIEEEHARFGKS